MSYQVLARKYRPQNFAQLVGQEHVARALGNALTHNRLHHAYLFTGTRGVGKTTIARILARCLNCEQGITAEPCGVCGVCREIGEGRFVDLLEIDAASNTGVDDVREVIDNAQYVPTRGRYKVYLIDEVHMLSKQAFNALLKTLEEPPPHVKFLLATTDPQKLPITVLSRCLQFALKPMSPERVVEHLQQVLAAENVAFDVPALWELGRAAQGSMRDALSLTDQAIAFGNGALREAEVREMLGSIDRDLVLRVLDVIQVGDGAALLDVIQDLAAQSVDFNGALAALISALHRIALAQLLPEAVDNSEGDRERILALAAAISAEDIQLYYQIALHGRRDLPLAPSARQGFEMCLLRMLAFRPVPVPPPGAAARPGGAAAARAALGAATARETRPVASPQAQAQPLANRPPTSSVSVTPAVAAVTPRPVVASRGVAAAVAEPVAAPAPTEAPPAAVAVHPAVVVEAPEPERASATILPFPAPVAETTATSVAPGVWTPDRWADWVVASGLSGMALSFAKHVLLVGTQQGEARLQVSPRHDIMAEKAAETLLNRLRQEFPAMRVQLDSREPEAHTPQVLEQLRLQARREAAQATLLADGTVQALLQAFDAQLLTDTLILGDKKS